MALVQFLGRLADIAGAPEIEFTLPDHVRTVSAFRVWLAATDPLLGAAISTSAVRVVVGDAIARDADPIEPDARIALLPAYSGG
jgi:molybdopterin converting factor small subunit